MKLKKLNQNLEETLYKNQYHKLNYTEPPSFANRKKENGHKTPKGILCPLL